MSTNTRKEYALSVEELAVAFSMVNRPDLGKAVLFETFGELSQQAIEERLKAASHSLLARGYAFIQQSGVAALTDDLQSALFQIMSFDGMIQVVTNETEIMLLNSHLGTRGTFTSHWVKQGVVHYMIFDALNQLPDTVAGLIAMPKSVSAPWISKVRSGNNKISMETISDLPEMTSEQGLSVLKESGLDPLVAAAFLDDLRQPKKRGSVSYISVKAETIDEYATESAVAGLFFLVGKYGWLLAFPKKENQLGALFPGTHEAFKEKIRELLEKKNKAFME
jgi:hypothetical protein